MINTQPVKPQALKPAPELLKVQGMMPMSADDRAALKESIEKEGAVRDPIRVYRDKKSPRQFLILAGFNRWEISIEIALKTVPIQVLDLKPSEREEYAIQDNLSRRHLTTKQKQQLAVYLIKADPTKSDRAIAKQVGISKNTAAKQRQELASRGQIDHVENKVDSRGRKVGKKKAAKKSATKSVSVRKPTKAQIRSQIKAEIKGLESEIERLSSEILEVKKRKKEVERLLISL